MSRFALVVLAVATALALGCRGSDNAQHDASINPHDGGQQDVLNSEGGGGGGYDSIAAMRNANLTPPTDVTINSAVVTGVNWSSSTAKAYIQDLAGGPKSGIYLYCKYSGTGTLCPAGDAIKALKMGQVVKVVGSYDVYKGQAELKPTAVTVIDANATALPPFASITAANAVETATSSDYAGCLVQISGVSSSSPLTVSSMTPNGFANSNYNSSGACCCGPPYSAFEVSDGTNKIAVTTNFYRGIDLGTDGSCIMIFDGGTPADKLVVVGDKFNKLSGILDVDSFDMNGLILSPTAKDQYEYVPAGDHDGGL